MSDNSPQLEAVLEDYLEDQAEQGQSLGQEDFTIDSSGALKKLAAHSLPFAGAWLLKCVQTAVASGCRQGVRVISGRKETVVNFDTQRAWTAEEVRAVFLDPTPRPDEVLMHLKYALWGAGISGAHPFVLHLPNLPVALVWSGGTELGEIPVQEVRQKLELVVRHESLEGPTEQGFFARRKRVSRINSETMMALLNNAYTCPVPLTLDGRRLDSLLLASQYCSVRLAQPVEIGFAQVETLPSFPIPLGTFDALRKRPGDYKTGAVDRLAVEAVEEAEQMCSATLAFLYIAHIGTRMEGKTAVWKTSKGKSNLFWIRDGVMVRHEVFAMDESALSLDCYVSGAGLRTDLTTLQLVASNEKAERTGEVFRVVSRDILKPRGFDFDHMLSSSKRDDRVGGAMMTAFGVMTLPILPFGLLMLWLGGKTLKEAGDKVAGLVKEVVDSYPVLQEKWKIAHPTYLPTAEEIPPC